MQRSYRRLLALFLSMIFIMIAGVAGYVLARGEPRIVQTSPEPDSMAVGADNARISEGATVTWSYVYEMCRHRETMVETADKSIIGLGFTQLQQKYSGVRIVSFDKDAVVLEKRFLCYCPLHYVLKQDGGMLSLFCTKAGTDEQEKIRVFDMSLKNIGDDEAAVLKAGRVFAEISDVELYISKLRDEANINH